MKHILHLFSLIVVFVAVCLASSWGLAQSADASGAAVGNDAAGSGAAVLFDKLIWQGGPIVWFQLAVSVVGLAFAVERIVHLRRSSIVPSNLAKKADQLWREGKTAEIETLCSRDNSTLSRMIKAIVDHRSDSPSEVATIVGEIGKPELKLHLQKAYPVITVATLEPMLGLFGTVWGMMGAFDTVAVAGEMGNPSILAADISVALITTAVGLAIAIPMLALYHYFKARTNTYAIELEAVTGSLIKDWLRGDKSSIGKTSAASVNQGESKA